jgi:uncharacterized protein YlzI (FlbEa/FlbD family)
MLTTATKANGDTFHLNAAQVALVYAKRNLTELYMRDSSTVTLSATLDQVLIQLQGTLLLPFTTIDGLAVHMSPAAVVSVEGVAGAKTAIRLLGHRFIIVKETIDQVVVKLGGTT